MKRVAILSITEDLQEMQSLLMTLGVEPVKEYIQKRDYPHRTGYLGPGRIEEIIKDLEGSEIDWIVINGRLKPSQHHFLEMKFQKECVDRVGVILRIFSDHAHTPEAINQVTLATLRYEQPFLREWVHKAKSGDRPGFLAGGAYATDVYYEHAKTHIRRIEEELGELSRQRETRRAMRRSGGYTLVSLAGYTNSGKSSLMNALCGSAVEVDERLFSTLSTTTRKVTGVRGNVLISDTVGFIRDLPLDLVKAFNSTLEEVFYSDLILLVFDAGEPIDVIASKLETSLDILVPKIETGSLLLVGNKADLIPKMQVDHLLSGISGLARSYEVELVSAVTGYGLDLLRKRIEIAQGRTHFIEASLRIDDQALSLVSRLHDNTAITQVVESERLKITIMCNPEDAQKILGWLEGIGAEKIVSRGPASDGRPEEGNASTRSEGAPV
jgi:GTP-binding protein HflX